MLTNTDDASRELTKALKGRVAVFIDAANLEGSLTDISVATPAHVGKGMLWKADKKFWAANYRGIYSFLKGKANLKTITFYTADFGTNSYSGFMTVLRKIGYRLVTKKIQQIHETDAVIRRKCKYCHANNQIPIKFKCYSCGRQNDVPTKGKADVDVEISVDAISQETGFDTFVLFSGDADYLYLLSKLKQQGKSIIVISRRGHISDVLRNSKNIDHYEDIYKLKDIFLMEKTSKKAKTP